MAERKLEQISDGKLYKSTDMVRAGCSGCTGCSDCCHDMGDTVVLDPYDVKRLSEGIAMTPQELLSHHLELGVVQGVILPHLAMVKQSDGTTACTFLSKEGRCTIHAYRPGRCRLFPLGRYYEGDKVHYILQTHECPKPNKVKVRVKDWIDTPKLSEYEAYELGWHNYLLEQQVKAMSSGEEERKAISLQILREKFGF